MGLLSYANSPSNLIMPEATTSIRLSQTHCSYHTSLVKLKLLFDATWPPTNRTAVSLYRTFNLFVWYFISSVKAVEVVELPITLSFKS